jgi:hypothetical protein
LAIIGTHKIAPAHIGTYALAETVDRQRILPDMRYLILGESLEEREQNAGSRAHWWRDLGPRP